jgi:hypothetical protein
MGNQFKDAGAQHQGRQLLPNASASECGIAVEDLAEQQWPLSMVVVKLVSLLLPLQDS